MFLLTIVYVSGNLLSWTIINNIYIFIDYYPSMLYNGGIKMNNFDFKTGNEDFLFEEFINVLSEIILEIIKIENIQEENLIA